MPYFPFPWYFPSTFLFAAVALAGLLGQLWASPRAGLRGTAWAAASVILAGSLWLTIGAARQVRAQQTYIEDGNRRLIGEWLKAHARPGDTVFLEPLGYIGYYSGLKTHDWPGLSSRELVEAKLIVGTRWGALIRYLQPDWLVLRPDGEGDLPALSPGLAEINYELVREFNRLDDVRSLDIPGRQWLEFDARFRVYHRRQPIRQDTAGVEIASSFATSIRSIEGHRMRLVHAPGIMVADLPSGTLAVSGLFGFPPEAYAGAVHTDGAIFRISWTDGTRRVELQSWHLNPFDVTGDRGLQGYRLELSATRPGRRVRLSFETEHAGNSIMDWTFWSAPEFLR